MRSGLRRQTVKRAKAAIRLASVARD